MNNHNHCDLDSYFIVIQKHSQSVCRAIVDLCQRLMLIFFESKNDTYTHHPYNFVASSEAESTKMTALNNRPLPNQTMAPLDESINA